LLVNNAGVLHGYGPIGATDYDAWLAALAVNALGPMRVLEAVLGNLRAGAQKKVVALTSGMASIGDNTSGGAVIYRSSKAALNMAMRTAAIDLGPEGFVVAVLSPGWVKTDMGGPGATLDPATSVAGMRRVIAGLRPRDNGSFLDWNGRPLPW